MNVTILQGKNLVFLLKNLDFDIKMHVYERQLRRFELPPPV